VKQGKAIRRDTGKIYDLRDTGMARCELVLVLVQLRSPDDGIGIHGRSGLSGGRWGGGGGQALAAGGWWWWWWCGRSRSRSRRSRRQVTSCLSQPAAAAAPCWVVAAPAVPPLVAPVVLPVAHAPLAAAASRY
jgi:hypothetical protein